MKIVTQQYLDCLTYKLVGAAIEVHKQLGPGLIESVYEKCYYRELSLRNIRYKVQQRIPINYKGISLEAELRYDVLAEELIIVELKSVESVLPVHEAVLLSYMKMLQKPKGLIINFNVTNIAQFGQNTFVNEYYKALPKV